jgi:hypothetical protein
METSQIKKELHEYIDNISDEKELMVIYDNTVNQLKSGANEDNINLIDPKVNHQQEELDKTIDQGNLIGNKKEKELNKSISRWFNDGGWTPD